MSLELISLLNMNGELFLTKKSQKYERRTHMIVNLNIPLQNDCDVLRHNRN